MIDNYSDEFNTTGIRGFRGYLNEIISWSEIAISILLAFTGKSTIVNKEYFPTHVLLVSTVDAMA